jgi:ABC-type polysaccharide/polyol phosphate transport system ATPase subunit
MLEISVESAATLFLRPDETAASFLSRSRYPGFRTTIPFLDRHLTSRQGTVLEIVGPSGAGKSALLYVVSPLGLGLEWFFTFGNASTFYFI